MTTLRRTARTKPLPSIMATARWRVRHSLRPSGKKAKKPLSPVTHR